MSRHIGLAKFHILSSFSQAVIISYVTDSYIEILNKYLFYHKEEEYCVEVRLLYYG
jgi:hypothetical protein